MPTEVPYYSQSTKLGLHRAISTYLDRPDVRSIIGADPSFTGNFSGCSDAVGMAFYEADDSLFPTQFYIAALLERGIRALIYVGANDWICNWVRFKTCSQEIAGLMILFGEQVGNERMTLALEWSGQREFAAEPLRGWKVDGDFAGLTRTAGPLTFVTIDGAGHMVSTSTHAYNRALMTHRPSQVPYDKPKHSLELVKRWLSGSDL